MKRVLVSTLPLWGGGVPRMTQFTVDTLKEAGYEPVLAYHVPYSVDPGLSVPSFQRLLRRPGHRQTTVLGVEAHEMGSWPSEFEWAHYGMNDHWQRVIDSTDVHMAASGNCLAAGPLMESNLPYLVWVATPWRDDRREREKSFSVSRRVADRILNRPLVLAQERRILKRGVVVALSEYTAKRVEQILGGSRPHHVLPVPIDTEAFTPDAAAVIPGRVGFVGRLDDPRKRVDLLIDAISKARESGVDLTAVLVGRDMAEKTRQKILGLGLGQEIDHLPDVSAADLPSVLRTVDVLVVPSEQEGLCIAALEGMACGCPVVSTRCGGPEEFVIDGKTGFLADGAESIAHFAGRIATNRVLRRELSRGARRLVEERYSIPVARHTFWKAFEQTFGRP